MGDPNEALIVWSVNRYQKYAQTFTAERSFLNELGYLAVNTTAVFVYTFQNHVLLK